MIFADTSFWVGLFNPSDDRHHAARSLWHSRVSGRTIITTNHVLGETWTMTRKRRGHAAAVSFLDAIENTRSSTVVQVDHDQEQTALMWLRRHDERVYSFVDATSFVVMKALGLTEALAFDGDFSAAGFVELRA